ncbi:MAG: sulfotransferase [Coleofasciculus sp. B1-GNL1-01]|uniref:sulfotransferase family protein n=1 Tax=Coleofasciculus sp. B1-GNL1-01 TaxID=3068484 RepID=UPI003301353A
MKYSKKLKGNCPLKVEYGIVLGCPRSGTTFLMKALKGLPNSECISGSHLPVSIPHIVSFSLTEPLKKALAFGFEHSLLNYLDEATNSQWLALQKWLKGSASITELIQTIQRKRKVERIVYKEPFLGFSPEFIYKALPNCRIIHIYRDGRDCANSLVRSYNVLTDEKLQDLRTAEMPLGRQYDYRYVPWWVEEEREEEFIACTPYVRAIWMWKEIVSRCHDFFSRPEIIASNRILLLKYEDFVNEPLKYGEIVVEFLGCKMNNRLRKKFKQASNRSIGSYQGRDPREIEVAERVAQVELEIYEYL